ncbi:MAG: hypothetical protein IPL90_06430 [Holophagales bacterium]|nr:hypothetical protein [Holophagales bacterium]
MRPAIRLPEKSIRATIPGEAAVGRLVRVDADDDPTTGEEIPSARDRGRRDGRVAETGEAPLDVVGAERVAGLENPGIGVEAGGDAPPPAVHRPGDDPVVVRDDEGEGDGEEDDETGCPQSAHLGIADQTRRKRARRPDLTTGV